MGVEISRGRIMRKDGNSVGELASVCVWGSRHGEWPMTVGFVRVP
jgi:hypothetical protein